MGSSKKHQVVIDPGEIDAVLFDMDGTLVDSDRAVERAWVSWAREYGADGKVALLPERCLVVEDAEVGIQAGRAAGAHTAALRGLDGDLWLDSLADLAEFLG